MSTSDGEPKLRPSLQEHFAQDINQFEQRRYSVGSRFTLRRAVTALTIGAAAAASVVITAPAAVADQPQVKNMRLLDECDKASWDAEFPGLCTTNAGSVTLGRFRADL